MIEPVPIDEITSEDLKWLVKAFEVSYDGIGAALALEWIAKGVASLYRFTEEASGIVLLQVETFPRGKRLWLYAIAGNGVFNNFDRLFAEIEKIGKDAGCSWFAGAVVPKGFQRKCFHRYGEPQAQIFTKDLNNV